MFKSIFSHKLKDQNPLLLSHFSSDLQFQTWCYLTPFDLSIVSQVCKTFRQTSSKDQLWKRFVLDSSITKDFKKFYFQEYRKMVRSIGKEESCQLKNLIKITLQGDSYVGKTSMLLRRSDNIFTEQTKFVTMGCDYKVEKLLDMTIQIWDTCGQERFRSARAISYKRIDAVILVFDLTSQDSFNNLDSWIQEKTRFYPEIVLVLAGNKSDLKAERQVSDEQIFEFLKKKNLSYFETSAKTGENIDELFNLTIMSCKYQTSNFYTPKIRWQWGDFLKILETCPPQKEGKKSTNLKEKSCRIQ